MKKIIFLTCIACISTLTAEELPAGTIQKGSLANDKLISDAKVGVAGKVATLGCKDLKDFTAYVVAMPAGKPGSMYWEEKWVVNGCRKQYPVDIKFAEDGKGGAFWTIKK